ncbi:hypothetical protein CPB86DRAFT_790958 [Serendipita vermifera]|nr:hypothetical protein CPB86DRAFT_790958 [Serendipita vermifera]
MIKTLHGRPPRGPSLPEQAQNTTPKLPIEIWWVILEIVLDLGPVVLENFAPCEILLAHEYFLGALITQSAARRHGFTLKSCLRQVCKAWKQIVDHIGMDHQQIQERKYTNTQEANERPITLNTKHHPMVTFERYTSSIQGIPVKYRYTHPVYTLKIRISSISQYRRDSARMESLSDVISFPKPLRALNLYMDACKGPMGLLKDIEEMSIPLTVLSLFLQDPLILQTRLTAPTLVSLFISIPPFEGELIWADPSRYRWKLPALCNLSLVEQETYRSHSSFIISPTHPFYIELLKHHMLNLRSLLMHPMTMQVYNQESPLCWANMPRLQVLATNFSNRATTSRRHYSGVSRSNSIRHLIQFHWESASISMGGELHKCIRMCTQLESVTVIDRSGFVVEWMNGWSRKEIAKFLNLCNERGITVWSQNSVLSPRRVIVTMSTRRRK